MMQLSLTLFGGFTAVTPTGSSPPFPTDKARALLAYLALTPDAPLRREALAGLFWPEQPEELARQNLRQTLSRLRKSLDQAQPGLGAQLLTVTRQTVELHGAYGTADVTGFGEQVTAVASHPHTTLPTCSVCLVRLETAVALYRRGDFLAGLSLPDAPGFEEWLLLQRERLYQSQLAALGQLAAAYEQQGAFDAAHRYALWQIELEPWREEAHRQVMRLLARNGERGQALAQYETCRQLLQTELGIEPAAETVQLWQQIKDGAYQPTTTRRTQIHHFPNDLTPFVGRERELAAILALLREKQCRVLTLLGPGGMGKTRLAVQVCRVLADGGATADDGLAYHDGAYFVPLTAVTDVEMLVTAVAQAVGLPLAEHLPPRQQLLTYLRDKQMLLVGDNFEQVAAGAEVVAAAAAAAPQVQWLLTSQQPLHVHAERRFLVGGLDYAAAETADAVQLFLSSARRVRPDFRLTAADLPALWELCRLLDGMPLALEIAAGWVRLMDCPAILRETQKSLDFLAAPWGDVPAQRQSVRAVLAHSWQQLPPHLQGALRRMALFTGGFTLEAALAVLPDVSMTDMAALLDKSLVTWRADGRYHMHQLLRTFVQQQSPGSPEEESLFRTGHCRYYLHFLADQAAKLNGQYPQQAIAAIQHDLDNVRQAWQWAMADHQGDHTADHTADHLADHIPAVLGQAVSGLGRFYHVAGLFEEGERQFLAALAMAVGWPVSAETAVLQAQFHLQLSHFLGQTGQYQVAIEQAQQAQKLAEALDEIDLRAQAVGLEGEWQRHLGQFAQARHCLDTAVTLFPTPNRNRGYARALNQIGQMYQIQSRYEAALAAFSQARQVYEAVGDQTEMSTLLGNMAEVYRLKADYPQALACSQQALALAEAIGYKQAIVQNAIVLAAIQQDQGEAALAQTTCQQALAVAKGLGYVRGIINSHISLGVMCLAQSKLAEAAQWLHLARAQAEEVGLPDLVAKAAGKQGIVHAHRGEHEAAVAAYEEAIQLWRLLNNQAELSVNLGNLGTIYLRLGQYERALDYYEQALTAVQTVGARQVAANMMLRLGNVYKRIGNFERAIACFEHALQTYQALEHKGGMANSLGWLGVMHSEMGEYAAAQARYEQAMVLSQEIGDHITSSIWLMNRAETAMLLGERELAEELAQQAVDLCRTLGNTRFLPGALVHQAEIFFAHSKYEQCRLVLVEALPLSGSAGDQKLAYDGRLLQARLVNQFGERETAVTHLRAMIADFTNADYQAELHFYWWQMTGDEAVRQTAVQLYEALLPRMPNYKLQQQLEKLRAPGNDA